MRTLLGISIVAVIAVTVWSNLPTQAKQQYDAVSIDPLAMTNTVTNLLPEVRYDQGTIFHDVQYDEGTI